MRPLGRLGIAAAACVIAVAGAAVFAGGFANGSARASHDGVPPVFVSGHPVPYDRPETWTNASASSRDARTLTVFATGSTDSGGDSCGPPVLRFRVTESSTTVKVLVAGYRAPAGSETSCPLVGYAPSPHSVRLQHPLGDRVVVDASTRRHVTLLIGTDHPDLAHPPAGLTASPLNQWEPGSPISRDWYPAGGHADGPAISLTDQSPSSVRVDGPYGRVALQAQIRGTPATVYQGVGGAPGAWFAQWTPNNRQTITLGVATAGQYRWNAASTLALARTVIGYTTSSTDRLGEPDVRGTVAATYNSADGPVRNATNLLKSSGVYVGLDCAGIGQVTVTIRGATTRYDCTARLGHDEFESTGPAFDAFRLSVDAGPAVRWSLSLARKTLDGS